MNSVRKISAQEEGGDSFAGVENVSFSRRTISQGLVAYECMLCFEQLL
jgi:hypothetical protein